MKPWQTYDTKKPWTKPKPTTESLWQRRLRNEYDKLLSVYPVEPIPLIFSSDHTAFSETKSLARFNVSPPEIIVPDSEESYLAFEQQKKRVKINRIRNPILDGRMSVAHEFFHYLQLLRDGRAIENSALRQEYEKEAKALALEWVSADL